MLRFLSITTSMILIISVSLALTSSTVKIIDVTGDVKVRRGLDEFWQSAKTGMILEEIDTILALEGKVELEIHDGLFFELGSNSMLDVGDLRTISKREMFLVLMSEKVNRLQPRSEKTQLKVGNVSVVHGESKDELVEMSGDRDSQIWIQEFNGAMALYDHEYYTNTIIKLDKILKKHTGINDCGQIYYQLANSFEKLNESGQAIDAYKMVLENAHDCDSIKDNIRIREAQSAINRLE